MWYLPPGSSLSVDEDTHQKERENKKVTNTKN